MFNWNGFVASATINRKRFVKLNATAHKVTQCGANEAAIGVSQQAPADPQGLPGSDDNIAARAGYGLAVLRPGEIAIVTAGGTVTLGTHLYVKSDSDGKAVAITGDGTDNIAGIPLHSASADEDLAIIVWPIPASD